MFLFISSLFLNIIEMNNWMNYIWVFSKKQFLLSGFFGVWIEWHFQLYAHVEIASRSSPRSLALSFLILTTDKRDVLSANNLALDFDPSGKSKIYFKKNVPRWILEELSQGQAASLSSDHLEEFFEICRTKKVNA